MRTRSSSRNGFLCDIEIFVVRTNCLRASDSTLNPRVARALIEAWVNFTTSDGCPSRSLQSIANSWSMFVSQQLHWPSQKFANCSMTNWSDPWQTKKKAVRCHCQKPARCLRRANILSLSERTTVLMTTYCAQNAGSKARNAQTSSFVFASNDLWLTSLEIIANVLVNESQNKIIA